MPKQNSLFLAVILFGSVGFLQGPLSTYYADYYGNWSSTEKLVAKPFMDMDKKLPGTVKKVCVYFEYTQGTKPIEITVHRNYASTILAITRPPFSPAGIFCSPERPVHFADTDLFSLQSVNESSQAVKFQGIAIEFEPDRKDSDARQK